MQKTINVIIINKIKEGGLMNGMGETLSSLVAAGKNSSCKIPLGQVNAGGETIINRKWMHLLMKDKNMNISPPTQIPCHRINTIIEESL
jgi:hypothetical protein